MDTTPYTTKEEIQNYMIISIDSSYDDQIDEWIVAMSRQIDAICKRPIYRTGFEEYLYDGNGESLLHISDCTNISSVSNQKSSSWDPTL